MSDKKYFYRGERLRCRAKLVKPELSIELQLQVYKGWWLGWQPAGSKIDVEVTEYPEGAWHPSNPRIFHYKFNNGHREIWNKAGFNLRERINKMFDSYCRIREQATQLEKDLKAMI